MDNLLIVLIVIVVGAYGIKDFYKRIKTQQECCCWCSVCTAESTLCKQPIISVNDVSPKV